MPVVCPVSADPTPRGIGALAVPGTGCAPMNLNALVTAPEISRMMPDVSRHLVGMWAHQGRLTVRGRRGKSPLYRLGEVMAVETSTRQSGRGRPRGTGTGGDPEVS